MTSDPEVRTESIRVTRIEQPRPPTTTVPLYRDELVTALAMQAFNRRMRDKVSAGGTDYLSGRVSAGNLFGAMYTVELEGTAKPGKWKEALQQLTLEMQRARLYGFSASELDDAKKQLIAGARRSVQREATSEAGDLLQQMNRLVTAGEPLMSAQQRLDLVTQLLPTITLEQVSQRLAEDLDPAQFSVTAILPSSADVPTESELLALTRQALSVKPQREQEVERATALMQQLPEPGEIVELTEHTSTGVWSGWLNNNVRFHYRFMDNQKNRVTVSISLLGGELLETAENRGITQLATVAWSQPATGRLSSADVRALLTGKNVSVNGGGGRRGGGDLADSVMLQVSGAPEDLETGMQLAHLLLTEPKVEEVALDRLTTMLRLVLEQIQSNPMMTGMQLAQGAAYPPDVARTQPLTLAQLDQLGTDAAAAQQWLDGLIAKSPVEVAIVGDVPKDEALELLKRYLGSLSSRPRVSSALYQDLRQLKRPEGEQRVDASINTQTPQAFVFSGFYGADETNLDDRRALTLASIILSTRMVTEIREAEQLVYSIRAGARPGTTYPGFGLVSASAPTDPAKVERLVEKIAEMYANLAKDKVTGEELEVAKRQVAVTLEQQDRDPAYWLDRLSEMTFYDRDLDEVVAAPAAYQAITAEQLRSTFAKYYAPEHSVVVSVKPDQ